MSYFLNRVLKNHDPFKRYFIKSHFIFNVQKSFASVCVVIKLYLYTILLLKIIVFSISLFNLIRTFVNSIRFKFNYSYIIIIFNLEIKILQKIV